MPAKEKIPCSSVLLKKYNMKILKIFKEEREIGEVFSYNGLSFICLESPGFSCGKCYFKINNISYNCTIEKIKEVRGLCSGLERSDGKCVHFEILTDENTKEKKN